MRNTFIAVALSILFSCIASGQTTQPSYATEFGAVGADIDAQILSYRLQLAAFNNQFISAGSDLAKVYPCPAIKFGTPGAAYTWNTTVTSAFTSGGFLGSGNTITITPVPGGSTGIPIRGDNISISGATLTGNCNALRIWGIQPLALNHQCVGDYLHDLNFASSVQAGITLDTWADNVTISHCQFAVTNAQGIYCTSDNCTVEDCVFSGSLGEHCARWDLNGSTSHRPANARIINCVFSNPLPGSLTINRTGKEALTFREVDGATVVGCTFNGWVSVGQGSSDTNWHARHITFIDCKWTASRPGGALLNVRHDADVRCIRCSFPASNTDSPVTGDARSSIYLTDCTLVGPAPSSKPIAAALSPTSTVVIETSSPTTQPTK